MRSNDKHHYNYTGRIIVLGILLIILFALPGCSNAEYIDRVVYVDRPVAIPCVTSIPITPVFETKSLTNNSDIDAVSKAYMIEIKQRKSYEATLEAIANNCAELPND